MEMDFRPVVIFWACLAIALMALEALVPGAALLWLGVSAGIVLLVVVFFPELPLFWQAVLFVVLAFVAVGYYWKYLRVHGIRSDQPLLNQRGAQLVGQVYVLESAIENGRGRLKIGDAFWQCEGPELAAGTRVRVVAAASMVLKVEPAA